MILEQKSKKRVPKAQRIHKRTELWHLNTQRFLKGIKVKIVLFYLDKKLPNDDLVTDYDTKLIVK